MSELPSKTERRSFLVCHMIVTRVQDKQHLKQEVAF